MKTDKGRARYPMAPNSSILSTCFELHGNYYAIAILNKSEFDRILKSQQEKSESPIMGQPIYCCFYRADGHDAVEFLPVPNAEYVIKIKYAPPIQEY